MGYTTIMNVVCKLLLAAGHDTDDLHQAIQPTMQSMANLKRIHEIACARFKAEGVKFHVVSDKNLICQIESCDGLK